MNWWKKALPLKDTNNWEMVLEKLKSSERKIIWLQKDNIPRRIALGTRGRVKQEEKQNRVEVIGQRKLNETKGKTEMNQKGETYKTITS